MTFIKYTNDGKAVIQPAALTLSGLEQEETLEMHILEKAIVLLKPDMEPVEKTAAMVQAATMSRLWSRSKYSALPATPSTESLKTAATGLDTKQTLPIR